MLKQYLLLFIFILLTTLVPMIMLTKYDYDRRISDKVVLAIPLLSGFIYIAIQKFFPFVPQFVLTGIVSAFIGFLYTAYLYYIKYPIYTLHPELNYGAFAVYIIMFEFMFISIQMYLFKDIMRETCTVKQMPSTIASKFAQQTSPVMANACAPTDTTKPSVFIPDLTKFSLKGEDATNAQACREKLTYYKDFLTDILSRASLK
jgi:hypothetical protein